MTSEYQAFLDAKRHTREAVGFRATGLPSSLFDFQAALMDWALWRGRSAVFADCGMGKTLMQLAWAEQVVRHTNGRVLILGQ